MDLVTEAALRIRQGEQIDIHTVLEAVGRATHSRSDRKLLERVSGPTAILGPLRGHASDFAHYLLTKILPNDSAHNIVFLGNYIDGAHQSVEVLYLVALMILYSRKRIVPLIGKHELLYPMQSEIGSLKNELQRRAHHTGRSLEQYEATFCAFFSSLSVACLIEGLFFCVAGGPAYGFRKIEEMDGADSHAALKDFVVNEQMDEDEERVAGNGTFVASQNEDAFSFTFNATCNFISRNKLATLIVGMEYHINRPDYDSFVRPNHYKESIYLPGFILGRIHPETRLPAVVTIFSAACFCGVNRNNACLIAASRDGGLEVQELSAYKNRLFITPGPYDHAFSWALPTLEKSIAAIGREMIFGALTKEDDKEDEHYMRVKSVFTGKMRRMCHLLKSHDLPLPEIAKDNNFTSTS